MPVIFRGARADELQRAQELVVGSINDLTERHGFGKLASVRPATFQTFSFNDDPGGLWVAENEGEIVGFAFSWACESLWFLAELFIAPRMQQAGIGGELLRRTLRHADQAGSTTRALITFTFNTVSQGLYLRHGMFPRLPLYMFTADRRTFANAGPEPGLEFSRIEAGGADMAALADLDRSTLGLSREKHHAYLLGDPAMTGFLIHDGGDCAGYVYVSSTGQVGPLAITARALMKPALRGALRIAAQGGSESVSVLLPGTCESALSVAADHRMRIALPMVLVSNRVFGDWSRYLPRNPGFM